MAINKYHFVFAYTTGLPGQKAEGEAGQFSSMIKNDSNVNKITEEEYNKFFILTQTNNYIFLIQPTLQNNCANHVERL